MHVAMSLISSHLSDCTVALVCHPATPCMAVRTIRVEVRRTDAALELCYRVEGDVGRVLLPAGTTVQRADGLWKHTCLEGFVRGMNTSEYLELNFSPSGEWAAYRFSGYRADMADAHTTAPRISVQREAGALQVDVVIDVDAVPDLPRGEIQLALSAVIEETDRRLSYWALVHPAEKPDFHHADAFALSVGGGG